MKIYLVGGAVRDKLLGLPIKERDWVVVGATVADLVNQGFRQVGKEFPVFLHPKTNEEYALARMERKVGPGYKGFTFDTSAEVTLEDDLERRDLTINAMAEDEKGTLIDPYHGKDDLTHKRLRHVSTAFLEDPVRILRVGRFLARFAQLGFQVAPETLQLMKKMVDAGEVEALVPERVWKELERALGEKNPEKFFDVLEACHALPILFPHLLIHGKGLAALQAATHLTPDTAVRFAALLHAMPEDHQGEARNIINHLCHRYRVPNQYRTLALLTAQHYATALNVDQLSAAARLQLLEALDVLRRESRFYQFLLACQAIAESRQQVFDNAKWVHALNCIKSVSVQKLLDKGLTGLELAAQLKKSRLEKLEEWLRNTGGLL